MLLSAVLVFSIQADFTARIENIACNQPVWARPVKEKKVLET
ncbi:MAG TPA: hypothetical protein VFE98_02650 [Candidatus Bathyarchaeia archaeon]|nr:hypothetical protein [Candidatus Bathyarchaeia archaeon]